ncbi:hypothetical protein P9265_19545 [Schinkia azotoformans]|uniref:hypothetical protein n=1 Tax=Schinkia azotoformans TaxID=1454 RepID=UPI002E24F958|nr:hypothetical protein [Schinkia azotoformans]
METNEVRKVGNVYMDGDVILVSIPELDFCKKYRANTKKGLIYNTEKGKYLKINQNKRFKYRYSTFTYYVGEKKYKKRRSVHALIYSAANGTKCEWWLSLGLEVNHGKMGKGFDGIKNLSLCSRKQQYQEEFDPDIKIKMRNKRRLTKEEVVTIKIDWLQTDKNEHKAKPNFCNKWSEELGCSYSCIEDIVNGKTWIKIKVA